MTMVGIIQEIQLKKAEETEIDRLCISIPL